MTFFFAGAIAAASIAAAALGLSDYPGPTGTRSFLADLRWTGRLIDREVGIEKTIRVVLAPDPGASGSGQAAPAYQAQMVHAMMGKVRLEDRDHLAFLFDGDGEGFYTRRLMDGLFVDLDDDGHVDVDQMSEEFGSFEVPFTMGDRSYEVARLDPEGRSVSLRGLGPAPALPPAPAPGRPAPDFSLMATDGRRFDLADFRERPVLVYFWASWCPACADQAADLNRIYAAHHASGLEILAISYDTDREAMEAFRRKHGQSWPTSFSGRQLWEDPVGRLYRARGTGVFYLVNASDVLEGIYSRIADVEARLGAPPAPAGKP